MTSFKFPELKNLHDHGFALHWLKPRSKMPVEAGWTKGPRLDWETFKGKYHPGFNVGVRLGSASRVAGSYLAVIDVDVKSADLKHRQEAERKLFEIFPQAKTAPYVLSGRGNASAHYYVRVKEPVSGEERKGQSGDIVKVKMPSLPPSKKEIAQLSEVELKAGLRLRPAWEISLMSEGRQVVLPGSVHPDTGKLYTWGRVLNGNASIIPELASLPPKSAALSPSAAPSPVKMQKRAFQAVDVRALGLRPDQIESVETGAGIEDRSAFCFSLCMALLGRKVSEEKIISLLTDQKYWLSKTAYDHAKTKSRDRAAYWVEKYCLAKAREKVSESAFDHEVVEMPSESVTEAAVPENSKGVFSVSHEWQRELDLQTGGRGAPPTIRPTFKNVKLILQNELGFDLLKRNVFEESEIWNCKTPWGFKPGRKRSGGMDDALYIKDWLIENYAVECPLNTIEESLTSIAIDNKFHPVKDFLESLEWDGVSRVGTAFKRYMGATMPEPYLTAVTTKFFLAMVARIYEPGIKFDHIPVFEGFQGKGKSTFLRDLVSEKWFLDGLPDLADKDAALNLQGIWLVEMGELSSLYRSQLETAKAFITRQTDKVRPPYGRRRQDYPRSCVFAGTTNDRDYLTDATGNRRFWPIKIKRCDFKALRRDRLQLLAEAKFLYDFCFEPLYLKGRAKKQAAVIQESRRVEDEGDSMETALHEWFDTKPEERIGPIFDIKLLRLEDLFDGPLARLKLQNSMQNRKSAGRILRKMGYRKMHTRTGKRWVLKEGRQEI